MGTVESQGLSDKLLIGELDSWVFVKAVIGLLPRSKPKIQALVFQTTYRLDSPFLRPQAIPWDLLIRLLADVVARWVVVADPEAAAGL